MIKAKSERLHRLTTAKFKRESPTVFLIVRNLASIALQGPPYD